MGHFHITTSNPLLVNYVPENFLCFNVVLVVSLILLSDDVVDGVSHHHA